MAKNRFLPPSRYSPSVRRIEWVLWVIAIELLFIESGIWMLVWK